MKHNRIFALALVLILALGMVLTGCGKKEEPAKPSEPVATEDAVKEAVEMTIEDIDHDVVFGMPVKSFAGLFYVELMKGAQRAIDEMNEKTGRNDEIIFMDDNKELNRELANVEDLLNMDIDAMLLVCMDPSGSVPAFEKCLAKEGLYTVIIDAPCDGSENADAVIVSNNYEAGRLEMEMLAKALDGKGSIIAISDSTNPNAAIREQGMQDELKNWPDIKLLEVKDILSGVDAAMEAMTSLLNAYPDQIDGVWNFSDTPAQGAVSAVEAAGKLDDIIITGIDGSVVAKELIQQGKQYGSAAQFPVELGYQGVMTAYNLLIGKQPEEQTTYVDVAWICKDNVADYIEEE